MRKQIVLVTVATLLVLPMAQAEVVLPEEPGELHPDLGDISIGSDQLANVYLEHEVDSFAGWYQFERVGYGVPADMSRVGGRIRMNPQGQVEYLEVNEEVLHDDPDSPLSGLPQNTLGLVKNFNMSVTGMTEDGYRAVYGRARYDKLEPNQAITVRLEPNWQEQFLPFDPPAGVNLEHLVVEVNNEIRGRYNSSPSGFRIWLDPLVGQVEYLIREQSTGEVISSGTVGPLTSPVLNSEHSVNFNYAGGVREIDLRHREMVKRKGQTFLSQIEADGVMIPAQVYMVRRPAESSHISFDGLTGTVEVLAWSSDGDMELLQLYDTAEATWHWLDVQAGPERLIVIFYGTIEDSFNVRFLSETIGKG